MGARASLLLDTCILITFGNAGRLDLITGLKAWEPVTSGRVLGELTKPPGADVRALVDAGAIGRTALDPENPEEQAALVRFDAEPAFRGRADAEVLALFETRKGFLLASDDGTMRARARTMGAKQRVAGTLDILVVAVREGRASITDVEALLPTLDIGPALERQIQAAGIRLAELI